MPGPDIGDSSSLVTSVALSGSLKQITIPTDITVHNYANVGTTISAGDIIIKSTSLIIIITTTLLLLLFH